MDSRAVFLAKIQAKNCSIESCPRLYANPLTASYFPTSYLWATVALAPPIAVAVAHASFVTGWRSRRRECVTDVVAAVLVMTLLVGAHTSPIFTVDLFLSFSDS